MARVGPLAVLRCQISAPGSRAPQGVPHQKLENTHHKREGERLPACEESPALAGPRLPGEASAAAAHSGAPERPRRCWLAPPGQGRFLTAGAQQQRPLCPAGWPGVERS